MRLLVLPILLLTAVQAISQKDLPQDDVHATLVVGKKKSLIAYAGSSHSFTMETTSKTAKPSDIPGFITIDGQVLQTTLVPAALTVDPRHPTTDREKEILIKYMNYELGYYKKKLKQKYSGLQTEWLTIKDHLFLVWYFDMPRDYKLVSRQIYFSTLFFDQVLDLNAPVFKIDHFTKARTTLAKLAGSLKTYDKQLDLGLLRRQL